MKLEPKNLLNLPRILRAIVPENLQLIYFLVNMFIFFNFFFPEILNLQVELNQ